jgi:pimeloyl-ACP methyl ester carboxylesterase
LKACRLLLCAALALLATACGSPAPPHATSAPAAVAATQSAASVDGVSIAWRRYGQGDPAIVLVHGWAEDATIWRAQLAALSVRHTVVTLDLGGQGASGANRQNWTLLNFAQDVAAVVAKLPNAQVALVGHGMGGPIALAAAPLVGARLAGIVGIETFRTLGAPVPLPSQVEQALRPFRDDFAGALRQYVSATLFLPRTDPAVVHTVTALMAQTAPDRGVAELAALNKLDYASLLPAVKTRLVVIDSDLGGAVDESRLHHAAPRLTIITLHGDDSFPMLDDTQRFNTTLLQAIDSLTAQ